MKKTILIVTHSNDHEGVDKVIAHLEADSHNAIRLDTDLFPAEVSLSLFQDNNNLDYVLTTPTARISGSQIDAVWYRRFAPGAGLVGAVDKAYLDAAMGESREVLLLYYREGQNSRQVAGLLGLQDAAVRKRLQRARDRVRGELLERLGSFARGTAPGLAFTTAVATALTIAAPPAAAATALGAGALGGAKGLAKLGLGAFGAAAAGIIGGLMGLWLGVRRYLREPFDERERRGVLLYVAVGAVLVVGFSVGINLLAKVPGWVPHLALSLGFMVGILLLCAVWLPRVLAPRRAREREIDPVGAAKRQARERRNGRIGAIAGLLLGTAGLVLGLWLSGRMG